MELNQTKPVVPKKVVLSKQFLKYTRGGSDSEKVVYAGNFEICNPFKCTVGFEFTSKDASNRFFISPTRGQMQPHETTNITMTIKSPHLNELLLDGTKIFVRMLPLDEKIEDLKLVTLMRQDRQRSNSLGEIFTIRPVVGEDPEEDFDETEAFKRRQADMMMHRIKRTWTELGHDLANINSLSKLLATLVMTGMVVYFGGSMKAFYTVIGLYHE